MSFGEPGGQFMEGAKSEREVKRAELAETIRSCCLQHDAKIADAILERFDVHKIGA